MQSGSQTTNYINADGEIVHTEESDAGEPVPVDNSACCALYDPNDISTFGMRGACETLETEIEGAEVEVFFELSPPACYKMVPSIRYLDLDGDMMFDMEEDQHLEDFDKRVDLDEDECCSALLEDEALDIFWDSACRTFV